MLAGAEGRAQGRARQGLHGVRAHVRGTAGRLPPPARPGAAPPAPDPAQLPGHGGHHGVSLYRDPQGFLPAAGYRHGLRPGRNLAGQLLCRDGRPPAADQQDPVRRSRHRQLLVLCRRPIQCVAQLHRPQALERAQGQCRSDHRPPEPEDGGDQRGALLPAIAPGRQSQRPAGPYPVSVHAGRRRSRRAEPMGAQDAGPDEDPAAAARRRLGPAECRGHRHAGDRPRPGFALRHHAAADRRHPL